MKVVIFILLILSSLSSIVPLIIFGLTNKEKIIEDNKCKKIHPDYVKKPVSLWTDGHRNSVIWILTNQGITTEGQGMTNAELEPLIDALCG